METNAPIICQVCKAPIRCEAMLQFVQGSPVCLICRCCHDDEPDPDIAEAFKKALEAAQTLAREAKAWADWVREAQTAA